MRTELSNVRVQNSFALDLRGQKYHSCGVKVTCADASFTGAASKLTWVALISNVRQEFYHWNFSKCNTYVRIINVQTGTHNGRVREVSSRFIDSETFCETSRSQGGKCFVMNLELPTVLKRDSNFKSVWWKVHGVVCILTSVKTVT